MNTRNVTMFLFCALACAAPCMANPNAMWTWVSGSDGVNQAGVYGTKGVAASGNVPGARTNSVSWADGTDNFWLFGGWGNATSVIGVLNDLWKFDGANWTWVSGSNSLNQPGVYGTKGVPATDNVPGAREDAASSIDGAGNLWLFGGIAPGDFGHLNDLWKFDGESWTWVSGSNSYGQYGVYGTRGVANPDNVPGARISPVLWIDASGSLWLFGGYGLGPFEVGFFSDLWKFDGTNWTWVSGSDSFNQYGVYGTKGAADSNNMPGARYESVSWIDDSGNLWLFGGDGYAASGSSGRLNDLWRFDGTNWIWVSGSNVVNQVGIYGTKGVADANNVPGARWGSVSRIADNGDLWLLGGSGNAASSSGYLNDLWKFDGTNWTWVGGSSSSNQQGVYGTRGIAALGNVPGARSESISWIDASGNLWLFGGMGKATSSSGLLNDLWKFGIPEEATDIVEDGVVDELDLAVLVSQWLSAPGEPSADLAPNPAGDGMVNFRDFAVLAAKWLESM